MAINILEIESGVLSREDCKRLKTLLRALTFVTRDDGAFPIYLDFNLGEVAVWLQTGRELRFSFCVTADTVLLRSEDKTERWIKVTDCSTQDVSH